MNDQLIIYMFSRREIESGDTCRFLDTFRPENSPSRKRARFLGAAMGNVMFAVGGYDDHPEDIYAIPEIRAFLKSLHSVWPCWLFFTELHSESLRVHALCMLEEIEILREKQSALSRVTFDPRHLHAWLRQGIPTFHALCRMAGLKRLAIQARLRGISAYFGVAVPKFHP